MVNEGTKIEETKYFGVKKFKDNRTSRVHWMAEMIRKGERMRKLFPLTDQGAKDASRAIDLFLIEKGLDPINGLKRVVK
jgi:hypothetical protein